jgi:hypothetical protein
MIMSKPTNKTMVIPEELPNLIPLSDSSSSSSEYGESYAIQSQCGDGCCAAIDDMRKVPSIVNMSLHHDQSSFRSDSSTCSSKKRVSFGNLEIRNYPVALGDHPNCSLGPPVSKIGVLFYVYITIAKAYDSLTHLSTTLIDYYRMGVFEDFFYTYRSLRNWTSTRKSPSSQRATAGLDRSQEVTQKIVWRLR